MHANATHYERNSDTDTQGSECDDFSGTTIYIATVEIGLPITAAAANSGFPKLKFENSEWSLRKSKLLIAKKSKENLNTKINRPHLQHS